jgi:hypothetical protein
MRELDFGSLLGCVDMIHHDSWAYFTLFFQIFDYIISYHHDQLRVNGYHDFHNAIKSHKSIPLTIVSLWNSTVWNMNISVEHTLTHRNFFVDSRRFGWFTTLLRRRIFR